MKDKKQLQKHLRAFLDHDSHSIEVQTLAHAMETAFLKLSPILTEQDGERFGEFIAAARASIGRYLAEHVQQSVTEVNRAKSN